ncbi:hypothetical protein M3Y97_00297700 [Aphelenchoides bicaudatus]|nr:hypothetical protein M3Y97_00297700 [Aphelenchoides bicaudatus]
MESDDEDNEHYLCVCGIHVQLGSFIFISAALLISMINICRGVANQDDFYTVGSLIDFFVVALALVGNRVKSKTMYQPFFAVHLILNFFMSVIAVLLFIKIYEKSEQKRHTNSFNINDPNQIKRPYDYSGPLLFSYIVILLLHSYALKVIWRSYEWMGDVSLHKKTNINALKILIARERQNILERSAMDQELALPIPV